jgi:predicted DCC family thiol-disulfide oxidoreductase YuxK
MTKNIIFFDPECVHCQQDAAKIIALDKDKSFLFSSFKGKLANEIFTGPNERYQNKSSFVLVENYESTSREFCSGAKATFKIFWILGGNLKAVGLLSFLPSFIANFLIPSASSHRHQFKLKSLKNNIPENRLVE